MPDDEFRKIVLPAHTGLLLPAVAAGFAFTVTDVDDVAVLPLHTVTVTVYVPEAPVVALLMDGLCCVEVKPFGPVQDHALPLLEERFSVLPAQRGLLLLAVAITPMVRLEPLSLPVLTGFELTTLILYLVPAEVLFGIFALIVPEVTVVLREPMFTGLEKLPTELLS